MNYFVEGIPGSGKTTLLHKLEEKLLGYSFFYEGDYSPIELAWNAYLSKDDYSLVLSSFPELKDSIMAKTVKEGNFYILAYTKVKTKDTRFYKYCENHEIYSGRKQTQEFIDIVLRRYRNLSNNNVFECSFFQNIIDELILYKEFSLEEILDFYAKLIDLIDLSNFRLIRLIPKSVNDSIEIIRKERVNKSGEEVWFQMMNTYVKNSPYGKNHPNIDVVTYFELRLKVESRIIERYLKEYSISVISKDYSVGELL